MAKPKRKTNKGGRPRKAGPRHPGGKLKPETTLPTPELMAKRVRAADGKASWMDQRTGSVLGIMCALEQITDEEWRALENYRSVLELLGRLTGKPRGFESREEGRSLANDDPVNFARLDAQRKAVESLLRGVGYPTSRALRLALCDSPEALEMHSAIKECGERLVRGKDIIAKAGWRAADDERSGAGEAMRMAKLAQWRAQKRVAISNDIG